MAIEDHRFYEHGAMDLTGTLRALVRSSQGNTQGGSSLTQQYVRLVLVETAEANGDANAKALATENTLARKVRELRYAIAMEKTLSKDKILEHYLNIAYYGDGAYGVEAAARHYFNTTAAKLDLAQSAMLAGLVRNPVATNPVAHPAVAIERRNNVLDRMAELSLITPTELAEAKAVEFDKSKVRESRLGCANAKFPFICDYVYRTLLLTPSLGTTPEERRDLVFRGGLTITTEIDPDAQKSAQKVVNRNVDPKDPAIGVIVMTDPQTGLIKAMAQSRPVMGDNLGGKKWKGETYYNYAVGEDFAGAEGFQGGSTFKLFVAAAALDQGFGVNTTMKAPRSKNFQGETFQSCSGSFPIKKRWVVDGEGGTYNLYSGTGHSVNNYYVGLEQKVGICQTVKMAKRVGLQLADGKDVVEEYNSIASFTLGSANITPLSMVTAYGTFANRGIRCNPIILKSITSKEGTPFDVPDAGCKRVIDEGLADAINKVFQTPFNGGTLGGVNNTGRALAGKTGTVPENRAEWTVAYTPNLVGAAVISYDSNKRFKKFWRGRSSYLRSVVLPESHTWLSGFGSDAGRRMLMPALNQALKDIKKHDQFQSPPASVLNGESKAIPSCSGMGVAGCRASLSRAGFGSYIIDRFSPTVAKGGLIGLSQSGTAPKGSDIAVIRSKGPEPVPDPLPTETPTPPAPPGKPRR